MAENCNILFSKMNLLVIDLLEVQFKLWSIFSKINTSLALWQPLLHTCVLFFRPTSSILRANRLSTTDYGSELPTPTRWSCLSTSTTVWTSGVISQSQRSSISAIQSQHSKYWTSFSTSQSVSTTEWRCLSSPTCQHSILKSNKSKDNLKCSLTNWHSHLFMVWCVTLLNLTGVSEF